MMESSHTVFNYSHDMLFTIERTLFSVNYASLCNLFDERDSVQQ